MKDVVIAILRSLGITLVEVRNLKVDSGNGVDWVISTDDWIVLFEYKHSTILIMLNEVSSKESWADLYEYYKGDELSSHKVKLANITAEELREVIEEFINKIGGEK